MNGLCIKDFTLLVFIQLKLALLAFDLLRRYKNLLLAYMYVGVGEAKYF